jgi:hypothetical protein
LLGTADPVFLDANVEVVTAGIDVQCYPRATDWERLPQ